MNTEKRKKVQVTSEEANLILIRTITEIVNQLIVSY